MTRAMFAMILWNLEGQPPSPAGAERRGLFSDVPDTAWYYNAVTWAAANGLIEGHNRRFDPTRAKVATMFRNFIRFVAAD